MRRGSVCSAYTPRIRYARWCRAPMMRPHIVSHAHTRSRAAVARTAPTARRAEAQHSWLFLLYWRNIANKAAQTYTGCIGLRYDYDVRRLVHTAVVL